jgi:hypothetical protein
MTRAQLNFREESTYVRNTVKVTLQKRFSILFRSLWRLISPMSGSDSSEESSNSQVPPVVNNSPSKENTKRAELVRKDKQRLVTIHKQQEEALRALREEQGDLKDVEGSSKPFLMFRQVEMRSWNSLLRKWTFFISSCAEGDHRHQRKRSKKYLVGCSVISRASSRKRRADLDEPEEIDDDVQDHFITRWTTTPPCIFNSVTFINSQS